MPSDNKVKADRVLEINESHPIFSALTRLYAEDQDRLREYAGLLYNQALLIEGMSIRQSRRLLRSALQPDGPALT